MAAMSNTSPLTCMSCGCALPEDSLTGVCNACSELPTVMVVQPDGRAGVEAAAEDVPPISKHHLLEKIGHGGMGTVYRGRQDSLQRDVAVKIVNASHNYTANVERF